jgi:prepilin-type N-terminal cleavage/methylation domain-containing protein
MDPTRVRAIMEKWRRDQSHGGDGSTLIELSIVLVIIGLIVCGVQPTGWSALLLHLG